MSGGFTMRPGPTGARFDIRVVPRGSKTAIAGVRDGALLVRVTAPPVDGAANDAVVDLLSGFFDVARRDVRVIGGETTRRKTIEIAGLAPAAALAKLSTILR